MFGSLFEHCAPCDANISHGHMIKAPLILFGSPETLMVIPSLCGEFRVLMKSFRSCQVPNFVRFTVFTMANRRYRYWGGILPCV